MSNYDSFIFEGHGKSEITGKYDPGAVNGDTNENDIVDKIVTSAISHLKKENLLIHRDEQNYIDDDLKGNVYTAKCGLTVHINAGGGSGVEVFVPSKEKSLTTDIILAEDISKLLKIPNRGIKSKDYITEEVIIRIDGEALKITDYYKEIRDAWSSGISLAILEVGFIDTNDINKIVDNIDGIGFLVAKYVATNCGVDLQRKIEAQSLGLSVKDTCFRVICGSFKEKDNAEKRKKELESIGYEGVFLEERKM